MGPTTRDSLFCRGVSPARVSSKNMSLRFGASTFWASKENGSSSPQFLNIMGAGGEGGEGGGSPNKPLLSPY